MKLNKILVIGFLVASTIPAFIVGELGYKTAEKGFSELTKQDMNERLIFVKNLSNFYMEKINRNEISKTQAIEEMATILVGPKKNNNRTIQGLRKGNEGYIVAVDSNGTLKFHPFYEGRNYKDKTLPIEVRRTIEYDVQNIHAGNYTEEVSWRAYEWEGPSKTKSYTKLLACFYLEPLDLLFISTITIEDFTAPAKNVRNLTAIICLVTITIVSIFSFVLSNKISNPFKKLSDTSSKIVSGDLSARVDIKSKIKEFSSVGKDINLMVDSLQSNIEKLRQALGSYSEVLSKVALGDLSARVDTEKLKEEYGLLGETLNSIVTILEYDTNELKRGEAELNQTISLCSDVLDKVAQQGDLAARIDVGKLAGKHKQIGGVINRMVDSLQSNIEELRQAIGSYSKVLNEVALGKLTARVDTEKLKEEYKILGDTLNSIVSILEYDTEELKKKEVELSEALTLYGYTLEKIVDEGDLSVRIDTDKLTGKHKPLGTDINYLISGLQTKIEESKKREKELKDAISAFNKVLNKTAKGDLTARIDTKGWGKELKTIGMGINTLIESLEYYAKEERQW